MTKILVLDGGDCLLSEACELIRASLKDVEVELRKVFSPSVEDCALLIVYYDALSVEERERLVRTLEAQPVGSVTKLLIISKGACASDYARLFHSGVLTNLLGFHGDLEPAEVVSCVERIFGKDIFGLRHYVPDGETLEYKFKSSAEKAPALERIGQFFRDQGASERLIELLSAVADEFITNAIYNAPVGPSGQFLFSHVARTEVVVLAPKEQPVLSLAWNGKRVGISIADPFGSLDPDRLLECMARCFGTTTSQIEQKQGGAGLGFYVVFQSLSQFVVSIQKGERTELIGLIDLPLRFRDFARRQKSFNVYTSW